MDQKIRERIEAEKKMSVNDFLNEREVKQENRNSILQSKSTSYLRVVQLGYDRIELPDKKKRLEHVEKMIEDFQKRDSLERQEIRENRYLQGLGIDVFKNKKVLGEVNLNKT